MKRLQKIIGIGGLVFSMMGCNQGATTVSREDPEPKKEVLSYGELGDYDYVLKPEGHKYSYDAVHRETGDVISDHRHIRALGWFSKLEDRNGDALGDIVLNFRFNFDDGMHGIGERVLYNTGKKDSKGNYLFEFRY